MLLGRMPDGAAARAPPGRAGRISCRTPLGEGHMAVGVPGCAHVGELHGWTCPPEVGPRRMLGAGGPGRMPLGNAGRLAGGGDLNCTGAAGLAAVTKVAGSSSGGIGWGGGSSRVGADCGVAGAAPSPLSWACGSRAVGPQSSEVVASSVARVVAACRLLLSGTWRTQARRNLQQRPQGCCASRSHLTRACLQRAQACLRGLGSSSHGMPSRVQRRHGRWSVHALLARWQCVHACSLGGIPPLTD